MLGLEILNEGAVSNDQVSKRGSSFTRNLDEQTLSCGLC
jgi:hypothetical protein